MYRRIATVLLMFSFFLVACGNTNVSLSSENAAIKEVTLQAKEQKVIQREITLSAIGDMLIHSPVYHDAKTESGYDFVPMLEKVRPYLERETITIANQETMIGGEELGLSTYPSFNSPHEVGDALKEVGVDVVTIANNHTLDRGEKAIQRAIEHWESIDMMYAGSFKDMEDREKLRVYKTKEGVSVAFLSYTYGTNGIPVPNGKDFLVNLIDKELIAGEIEKAKNKADVVILSLHFGNEYERLPNKSQKDLVQFAADQGVHAVIGHHPHVLQPLDWVEGKNGNKTLVAYSLGNFLSNQQGLYKRIGGILNFSVTKTEKGDEVDIEVHSPEFLPTYVTFNSDWSDYQVVPMYQLTNKELSGAENHYEKIKDHMSQWMPELEFIEN
ncbi:CapA family protein [Oceanobacillus halophilus]|uniref:CapA family protein n=1 Tax=Oceanobacillus halophilus TaxID=930130 RepID=A0A495A038_9BACI|nr:CapA family protein [Oceanobacillus halophilus]RKQ30903.1 CapA family protein [Oceanobacillus halophilus]